MSAPHDHDLDLYAPDIAELENAQRIAAFFDRMGYDARDFGELPHAAVNLDADDLKQKVKHVWRVAGSEDGDLHVLLLETRSMAVSLTQAIARRLAQLAGDYVLIVTRDFETFDFVLVERVESDAKGTLGLPKFTVYPRFVTVNRRDPGPVALRVLKRFTFTESDGLYQWDKLRSAFTLAEWSEPEFNNRALFSDYTLKHRLADPNLQPQWRDDVRGAQAKAQTLLADARDKLAKADGQRTRDELIEPLFKLMGFAARANKPGHAVLHQPDYDLFAPGNAEQPLAQALVYKWNRNLDAADPTRDSETPDENPAARVVSLLERAATPWVIVTNGKMWRLYSSAISNKITNYYEIDLEEAIFAPSNDREAAFKYWWLLFRQRAFDPKGLLDQTLSDSREYARQIGERLKSRVFEDIFIHFADGFIQSLRTDGMADDEMDLDAVFTATMTFLYRLMFVLYAESLELVPVKEENGYGALSVRKLKFEIAGGAGNIEDEAPEKIKGAFTTTSTALYKRLVKLFRAIDRGDADLNLPVYNGGLFSAVTDAGKFLEQHAIPDRQLALGLDRLARDVDDKTKALAMIDFKSLGVRQLGSIYEGLLEFKLRIAPHKLAVVKDGKRELYMKPSEAEKGGKRVIAEVRKGQSYLENTRQERKATGSYYTPDYIVEYIVQHTVGPVLEEKFEALKPRLREAQKRFHQHKQHTAQKNTLTAGNEDPNKFWGSDEMRRLAGDCLNVRVLDPAMGSGHFLVEAVDFISNRLIDFLNGFPDNPVWAALERTRADILSAMAEQRVSIDQGKLTRVNLLKRAVLKRCIFGVDLNKMAVELAKVSLWLDAFTLGAPLSFLDHHLKHGNSLIGARIKEVQDYLTSEQQTNWFHQSEFAGVMLATDLMRHVSEMSDNTVEQVRQSADEFRKASDASAPFKRLLDVYTARWFGAGDVQMPAPNAKRKAKTDHVLSFLKDEQTRAWLKDPEAKKLDDSLIPASEIARVALQAAEDKRFFHWELEFPEVFIAPSTPGGQDVQLREGGGFDAVVGNPPYLNAWSMTKEQPDLRQAIPEFVDRYGVLEGHWDLFMAFVARAIELTAVDCHHGFILPNPVLREKYAVALREHMLKYLTLERIFSFGEANVFDEVSRQCIVYTLSKRAPSSNQTVFVEVLQPFEAVKSISLPAAIWLNSYNAQIRISEHFVRLAPLLDRIASSCDRLGQHLYVNVGATVSSKLPGKFTKEDIVTTSPKGNAKNFFDGNDVDRWEVRWEAKYLDYQRKEMSGPRVPEMFEANKIVVKIRTSENERLVASLETTGMYCDHTVIVCVPYTAIANSGAQEEFEGYEPSPKPVSPSFVASLLNSTFLTQFFRNRFATGALQGSYSDVWPQSVREFPIRRISFNTPAHHRKELLKQAQTYYRQNTTDGHARVLESVTQHLAADQADVVHDILAYLAEQMIDLNKRKQVEVKRFLGWLEKALKIMPDKNGEASISSLKKKSKIQNYLGDYQKGQRETEFDEFFDWLYDNRNRFGTSLEGLRGRIEAEYEKSLAALMPIKRQLQATDALIDRIVYQLYGLTEDEIKLIEYSQFEQAVTTAREEARQEAGSDPKLKDKPADERADAVIAAAGEKIGQAAQQFFERVAADDIEARLRADLPNWDALPEPVKLFLKSGEMVLAQSAHSPLPEYSGVAISFAKAAETALNAMLFAPFRAAGHTKTDCANEFLKKYMDGGKPLTLGNMAFILPSSREPALRAFVQQRYPTSAGTIFDPNGMLRLLDQSQINHLRNASAHDGVLTLADAQAARAWAVGILGYL
jgi:hypothetical protein